MEGRMVTYPRVPQVVVKPSPVQLAIKEWQRRLIEQQKERRPA
jgi:hypothetical protein